MVGLPGGAPWIPLAGLVLVVVILALLGYRELRRADLGFGPATGKLARSVYLIAVEQQGERRAIASAFAVSANGLLATTAHVAAELERRGALSTDGALRAVALLTDSESERRFSPNCSNTRFSRMCDLARLAYETVREMMTAAVDEPDARPGMVAVTCRRPEVDRNPRAK